MMAKLGTLVASTGARVAGICRWRARRCRRRRCRCRGRRRRRHGCRRRVTIQVNICDGTRARATDRRPHRFDYHQLSVRGRARSSAASTSHRFGEDLRAAVAATATSTRSVQPVGSLHPSCVQTSCRRLFDSSSIHNDDEDALIFDIRRHRRCLRHNRRRARARLFGAAACLHADDDACVLRHAPLVVVVVVVACCCRSAVVVVVAVAQHCWSSHLRALRRRSSLRLLVGRGRRNDQNGGLTS